MRSLIVLLAVLAGCSAAPSASQQVAIRTDPPGAACAVRRAATVLGTVDPTPGTILVDRSDKDLLVTCSKPGWQTASGVVGARYQGIGLGRLLTGGAAAVVEDAANSTDFQYDAAGLTLPLQPSGH